MASINLSGVLIDPTGEFAVGDKIRFTHKSTTGETIQSAVSELIIGPTGAYNIDLEYGLVLVEYNDVRRRQYKNLGVATVNQDNPATSIPELLNALVPVSSPELIEFQAILADCVAAQTAAELAETNAQASEVAAAGSAASIDVDNLPFIFDTVALMKSSTTVFPIKKQLDTNAYSDLVGRGEYIVKTAAQAAIDGDVIDERNNHTLNDGKVAILLSLYDGNYDIRQGGVVYDYDSTTKIGTDNTLSIQAAVNIVNDIHVPAEGKALFTATITLANKTKFIGPSKKGTFVSLRSSFNFKPAVLPASTTLNGAILAADTTITLTDSAGFPTSGRAQIGEINVCEYVSWTGVSGNDLTGVTRDAKGGTEIAVDWADLTVVNVMLNAFELLGASYTGSFIGMSVFHEDFVDSPKAYGRGNALFCDIASFATLTDHALFFGFERCIYGGDAFVTSFSYPMTYKSRSGIQLDVPNGATIYGGDQGEIGDSSVGLGVALLAKGGQSMSVFGGNWGNGSNNTPFMSNGCRALNLFGIYTEAAKQPAFHARREGVINASGYVKSGFQIGKTTDNGEIYIDRLISDNIDYIGGFVIFPTDGTGKATIEHWNDLQIGQQDDFTMLNGKVVRSKTLFSAPTLFKPESLTGEKTLTSASATGIVQCTSTVGAGNLSEAHGFVINYTAESKWSAGQVMEKGSIQVAFSSRSTLGTTVDVTVDASPSQAVVSTGTLTVAAAVGAITGSTTGTQTFDIEITATTNASQDTEFKFWLDEIENANTTTTIL